MTKKQKQKGGGGAAEYGVQIWGGFDQINNPSQGNVIQAVGLQQTQVQQTGGSSRNRCKKIRGGGATPSIFLPENTPISTNSPTSSIAPGSISSQLSSFIATGAGVLQSANTQLENTNPGTLMETTTSTTQTPIINSQSVGGGGRRRRKIQNTKKTKKRKQRKSRKRF
jgi:hypothetical protein